MEIKDFSRLFVTTGEKVWGSSEEREPKSKFVIRTLYDGDYKLELVPMWGCDPTLKQVLTAIGLFVQEYEKEFGEKISDGGREYRHRYIYTSGSSGCIDVYIEEERISGFPDRTFLLHESCFNKVAGFKCKVHDIMNFAKLASTGYIKNDGTGYTYDPLLDIDNDGLKRSDNFKVIRPRITSEESGWSLEPTNIVPLDICRNLPDINPEEE